MSHPTPKRIDETPVRVCAWGWADGGTDRRQPWQTLIAEDGERGIWEFYPATGVSSRQNAESHPRLARGVTPLLLE